jgi:hypothetical protein
VTSTLAADRDTVEVRIRNYCESGEKQRAATTLLEAYGRELLRFLIARLRDRDAASEVFSQFTEDLWRGLDGFRWKCSARVWSFPDRAQIASSDGLSEPSPAALGSRDGSTPLQPWVAAASLPDGVPTGILRGSD